MEKNNYNKLNLVDSFTNNNQTLPHDNEAEEILLGALISDNNSVEYIENGLSDFHFYVPMLGRIFKAVLELANKDQIANPLTLDHYFADDKQCLNKLKEALKKSNSNLIDVKKEGHKLKLQVSCSNISNKIMLDIS